MVYRVIGLMSGSSLDGLDIVFAEIEENGGKWKYQINLSDCIPYDAAWSKKLQNATSLYACDYMLLHAAYGHYIGEQVNAFIEKNNLHYKVGLIASHGHTTFHAPTQKMTAQLGDGAAIAAVTKLPVVTDLRAMDVALGGQGAPIVPIGEKLLFNEYDFFLNIGGIANISKNDELYIAFDVCPANRVLNMLAAELGHSFDTGGELAASGQVNQVLFDKLNTQDYYKKGHPKSLANDFGTDIIYPLIKQFNSATVDALRTYTEHIALQITNAIASINATTTGAEKRLLITGGGALNHFLVERLQSLLQPLNIEAVVPEEKLVLYKEALIMALIAILRWREESNTIASVTGAARSSVGGALWMGQAE